MEGWGATSSVGCQGVVQSVVDGRGKEGRGKEGKANNHEACPGEGGWHVAHVGEVAGQLRGPGGQ